MRKVVSWVVGVALIVGVAPLSIAWNLVNKANHDPHVINWDFISVSGSGSAFNNGVANQYPGKVECRGTGWECNFGPMSVSFPGSYFPMGCEPVNGGNCLDTPNTAVKVNNSMTWDQAISLWVNRYGTTLHRHNAYTFYSITTSLCTMWGSYTRGGIKIVPNTQTCGGVPTVPNQCTVSGGTVDLNHGILNIGDIRNKKVEVSRQVSCTRSTSIKYNVSLGNPVDLGNGMSSLITVNGVAAGQAINLPGGSSTLRIASTLTDNGAKPGAFSKTVVLIQCFM